MSDAKKKSRWEEAAEDFLERMYSQEIGYQTPEQKRIAKERIDRINKMVEEGMKAQGYIHLGGNDWVKAN